MLHYSIQSLSHYLRSLRLRERKYIKMKLVKVTNNSQVTTKIRRSFFQLNMFGWVSLYFTYLFDFFFWLKKPSRAPRFNLNINCLKISLFFSHFYDLNVIYGNKSFDVIFKRRKLSVFLTFWPKRKIYILNRISTYLLSHTISTYIFIRRRGDDYIFDRYSRTEE